MRRNITVPALSVLGSLAVLVGPGAARLNAQRLVLLSGNGQLVMEQFLTTLPFTVQAVDPANRPIAGVAVQWTIPQGMGTLVRPDTATDSNGQASVSFLATNVPPGNSYSQATVTASTSIGGASFVVTTTLTRTPQGFQAPPPLAEVVTPAFGAEAFAGPPGATLSQGLVIRVVSLSGAQAGQGIPNIGVRLVNDDPSLAPSATCISGMVLTDSTGVATCDVLLSRVPGFSRVRAAVGEFTLTTAIEVHISAGPTCTYALSPASASVGASGGSSSFQVTSPAGCNWTAASNAAWITVTSAAGSGNAAVSFSVAANAGASRTGTLTVGDASFTVNQAASGPGGGGNPVAITTSVLPRARAGQPYAFTLAATGGKPPYSWTAAAAFPSWLALTGSTGDLSGTPPAAAAVSITVQVSDSLGATASRTLPLTVDPAGSGLVITNTSFANGVVGTAYRAPLTSTGGCATPFSRPSTFTLVSGQLPNGLALAVTAVNSYEIGGVPTLTGSFSFVLMVTDPCGQTATGSFAITIGTSGSPGSPPRLAASPQALSFRIQIGGVTPPAQTISIASGGAAVGFSASSQGASWLALSGQTSGNSPATLTVGVSANALALAPGAYNGTITIVATGTGQTISVPVVLTVVAAPNLSASVQQLSFRTVAGSGSFARAQQAVLISTADAVMPFSVSSSGNLPRWLSISITTGRTPATLLVQVDTSGLAAGGYTASLVVSAAGASGSPITIPVTVTVSPPPPVTAAPGSLAYVFRQGAAPPPNQQIVLGSAGVPIGYSVTATTTSGGTWLFVSSPAGTTPGALIVLINPVGLTAGNYEGAIRITSAASGETVVVTVNLTILEPPPAVVAVTSAASFLSGPVSPGQFLTIFGSNLGPVQGVTLRLTQFGLVDDTLADCKVLFDGTPAPVIYASSRQVTVIAPYALVNRSTTRVEVEYRGMRSSGVTLAVAAAAPGIFTVDPSGQAAALNEDGSVNTPGNPAEPGSIISLFATGAGETNPAGIDGKIATDTLPVPLLGVSVEIGAQAAEVTYSGAAPGLPAGILQVNARLPDNLPAGRPASLLLKIGGRPSQPGVTVAIR